jgi:hypothetical protein
VSSHSGSHRLCARELRLVDRVEGPELRQVGEVHETRHHVVERRVRCLESVRGLCESPARRGFCVLGRLAGSKACGGYGAAVPHCLLGHEISSPEGTWGGYAISEVISLDASYPASSERIRLRAAATARCGGPTASESSAVRLGFIDAQSIRSSAGHCLLRPYRWRLALLIRESLSPEESRVAWGRMRRCFARRRRR